MPVPPRLRRGTARRRRAISSPTPTALVLLAAVALAPAAVRAQAPSIVGTYTPTGGFFDYNLSVITPAGSSVGFILTDTTVPLIATVDSLVAPAGFQIQDSFVTDSGTGTTTQLLSFLPDAGSAAEFLPGTTVSGFRFRSDALLIGAPYSVTDDNGVDGSIEPTYNGTLSLTQAAAPEPSTGALLLAIFAPGLVALRRRRRSAAAPL